VLLLRARKNDAAEEEDGGDEREGVDGRSRGIPPKGERPA
jgi:hypothetical protein